MKFCYLNERRVENDTLITEKQEKIQCQKFPMKKGSMEQELQHHAHGSISI